MWNILERRSAAFAGTVCALLFGMSGVANADDPIMSPSGTVYSNTGPVNVRVFGGEVPAIIRCLVDARDGVINVAVQECNQKAIAGNVTVLDLYDVNLAVYAGTSQWQRPLYRGKSVDAWISGSSAAAINQCLADAHDGVINTAMQECNQTPVLGNTLVLSGVGIDVYE